MLHCSVIDLGIYTDVVHAIWDSVFPAKFTNRNYLCQAAARGEDHSYDPVRPWNWVLQEVIADKQKRQWWHEGLEMPALALTNGPIRLGDVLRGDVPVQKRTLSVSPRRRGYIQRAHTRRLGFLWWCACEPGTAAQDTKESQDS